MSDSLHVVLLAGGGGTRFWPSSRRDRPKQFLSLAGPRSLLKDTWRRATRIAPKRRVWVVAPAALSARIRRELPALRPDRLVVEPVARGSAAAIGLACAAVARAAPGAVAAILPTDHVIRNEAAFARALGTAVRRAEAGGIVCLGVRPDRPAPGFGYIEPVSAGRGTGARRVVRFTEKPTPARAAAWSRAGRHLWNAGIVVARPEAVVAALERHASRIHAAVAATGGARAGAWKRAPKASFDHAVLEKARGLWVVPLNAGWADVGTWDAAAPLARAADVALSSPGAVVFGDGRVVALVDVPGVVVVDTRDALLVVARRSAERLREVVAALARTPRGRRVL